MTVVMPAMSPAFASRALRRRPVATELLEDERVVGRGAVERDLSAGQLAPTRLLLVGITDDGEARNDELDVA